MRKKRLSVLTVVLLLIGFFGLYKHIPVSDLPDKVKTSSISTVAVGFHYEDIPKWNGKAAYVTVNDNKPFFTDTEKKGRKSYEKYGSLDSLGRCSSAISCIGTDLMPKKQRGYIGDVRPTGWHTVKYKGIDGNYLYNRCHLIGYQLTGENDNPKNLITGTRFLNINGMLPFENEVADYLHMHKDKHVLYRVTPVFRRNELLARGVLMEGYSVEDHGRGVLFCAFCYNVQPGIKIDYSDGRSFGSEYTGPIKDSSSEAEEDLKKELRKLKGTESGVKKYLKNGDVNEEDLKKLLENVNRYKKIFR